MPQLTIATFNAENLFARFKFKGKRVGKGKAAKYVAWTKSELQKLQKDGWLVDKTKFDVGDPAQRRLTAGAIKEARADVVCLQEIEGMETLRRFNTKHLVSAYPYHLLIDSHDPRLIDVALLSKFPIAGIVTHQFTKKGRSYVFSRDCLEVAIDLGGGVRLPLFVNHLKSMIGGRANTAQRRLDQAVEIGAILQRRFGGNLASAPFIVCGDMNDYLDPPDPSVALQHLLGLGLVNVNDRIPNANDRWTHYYSKGDEYRQLDYILLSPALAAANPAAVPTIIRAGMPRRATRYTGRRLDGVGENEPKASDHCPVAITVVV